jgi:hypothetical protein
MTMALHNGRLCPAVVECFRPDGSLLDLAAPDPLEVDFSAIAGTLSRIPRFNGTPSSIGFSVAQHCMMGAEALLNEGVDEVTALLFLLHDAHEHFIGDWTFPAQRLVSEVLQFGFGDPGWFDLAMRNIKSGWNTAIYAAAGTLTPDAWTKKQKAAVSLMDQRMLVAETAALFGREAVANLALSPALRDAPPPKFRGGLKPWGAMKAEEAFVALFIKLAGEDRFYEQRAAHVAHAANHPRPAGAAIGGGRHG